MWGNVSLQNRRALAAVCACRYARPTWACFARCMVMSWCCNPTSWVWMPWMQRTQQVPEVLCTAWNKRACSDLLRHHKLAASTCCLVRVYMLFSDAAWLKKCGNSKITNGNNEEINKDSTDRRCSWPRHLHCILSGICIDTWIWPWFWIAGQHNARSHDVWSSKGPRHTSGPWKTWMTWLRLSSRSWHHRPLMCSPEQASLAGQDFFYTQSAPAETHHFYGTWL